MTIRFITNDLRKLERAGQAQIIVFKFAEIKPLRGVASLVDWRLNGHLSRLVINDFLTGAEAETLLMPLGDHLSGDHLLVFGLGNREDWNKDRFEKALERTFTTIENLGTTGVVIALPGRPENQVESTEAIDWFLSVYEKMGADLEITIVEPLAAQSAMLPAVERWRLRHSIPTA